MNGQVLNFDIASNSGVITGEDGNRYNFTGADWMDESNPARGMAVVFDADGNHAFNIYGDAPAPPPQPGPAPAPTRVVSRSLAVDAARAVYREISGMLFSLQPDEEILAEVSGSGVRSLVTTRRLVAQQSEFFGLIKDETYIPLENIDSVTQGRTINKTLLIIGIITIPICVGILIAAFAWFFTRKDAVIFESGAGETIVLGSRANRMAEFISAVELARQARAG